MSIFAIGDPHLSFGTDKPMDIFHGWDNYVERLKNNWEAVVNESDIVVLPGDISWAMSLEEAYKDLSFLNSLPGKKIIMKGNHDYWWNTKKKMDAFLYEKSLDTVSILHNNAYRFGDFTICGSRGWFFDSKESEQKVILREAGRLRMSIESGLKLGGELIVFLHYPPITLLQRCEEIMSVLKEYQIKRCFYGHLHGGSAYNAFTNNAEGIDFRLVSADFLKFCPALIEKF